MHFGLFINPEPEQRKTIRRSHLQSRIKGRGCLVAEEPGRKQPLRGNQHFNQAQLGHYFFRPGCLNHPLRVLEMEPFTGRRLLNHGLVCQVCQKMAWPSPNWPQMTTPGNAQRFSITRRL